jgi:hypothetical protein
MQNPAPFATKITCGGCGKKYIRKKVHGRYCWRCSTFHSVGKEFCPTAKQIPEDVLIVFIEEFGDKNIDEIIVPAPNRLAFMLKDGTVIEREWQDRSRSLSWTNEMREAARQKSLARRKFDGKSD